MIEMIATLWSKNGSGVLQLYLYLDRHGRASEGAGAHFELFGADAELGGPARLNLPICISREHVALRASMSLYTP